MVLSGFRDIGILRENLQSAVALPVFDPSAALPHPGSVIARSRGDEGPTEHAVLLRLTMEQKSFEAPAKVVCSMIGMGMGLAFTSIEPEQLWVLESWLERLSGEIVPERKPTALPPEASPPLQNASPEPGYVLNELINTLMRKRVLTEEEGKALLKKLMN